jgi:hypothetical protein
MREISPTLQPPAGSRRDRETPSMNPKPNPDVLWRRLDDEVILMQLKTDQMFSLNRTGARLWELIAEGLSFEEIRERMALEFEISPDRLTSELGQILDLLIERQLLTCEDR